LAVLEALLAGTLSESIHQLFRPEDLQLLIHKELLPKSLLSLSTLRLRISTVGAGIILVESPLSDIPNQIIDPSHDIQRGALDRAHTSL